MSELPNESLELRSCVQEGGSLQLSLESVEVRAPGEKEVVVRMEAAPINPSDLGVLLGPAVLSSARNSGTAERPVVTADIPKEAMPALAARVGESMPVGNEGAGVVVAAGSADYAQGLLGKTVALSTGGTYAQYKTLPARALMPLPEGVAPRDAASCFVNPLTALGMVETMKREGHSGLVHTAAASNLGRMLVRVCLAVGVPLVNIVRRPEQVALLKEIGAKYVCDTSSPSFHDELTEALAETGATLGFDAIGGGTLAAEILTCMERALTRGDSYQRYGSDTLKQVYVYGALDVGPTVIERNFGLTWGMGGWLLTPFLQQIGMEEGMRLQQRVVAELDTTFASSYSRVVSLAEALQVDHMRAYRQKATGEKYLIEPNA